MQLELQQVTKRFGEQLAVDGVSFAAGRGVTGFLGPNGAGKSTTMRMVAGYLRPTSGRITLDGAPVWPTTPAVRARVGYLPEHNPLYPELYIREYLGYVARLQSVPDAARRVRQVVEQVDLGPEIGKRIGQLSKGFRQRVGLAQALLHDPPLLILDEPTSGFDPLQLADIRDLLRRLGEEKIVLLSTHIMQEVQALCERVVIIDRGRIVADGPLAELNARFGATAAGGSFVVECAKAPDAALVRALPGVADARVEGCRLRVFAEAGRELRSEVAALCLREGWGVLGLRAESADVEATFQALTRENAAA